ncbi:sodium:solute symporter family protein [Streptomyces paromomycinus]|uniref:Putative symporter YodF n=1 Tax=Streptomyces paromomycinus TaxID=92743 RepID=A0A401WG90_STREY|nr:sodium:solute symporter family protein [Streptomyces paromomycinus]GCD48372.1 putative symporter YodF [Streptomyces paromomycinus]
MNVFLGYGMVVLFFCGVLCTLYVHRRRDADFTDYAVGGRSFGSGYQTMSVLNTWFPGSVFIADAGMAAGSGVIGFHLLVYGLFAYLLMYLMSRRVWMWGERHGLRTQSDLFGLRYGGTASRTVPALIQVLVNFPMTVLGMQAMGLIFYYISFGRLSYSQSVLAGVLVLVARQFWTVRMGMRGVVVTDFYQGMIAYVFGSALLVGLIVYLAVNGHGFARLPLERLTLPADGDSGGLYLFALTFTGSVGGWCLSGMFVRLFTADGVRSVKRSAVFVMPASLVFAGLLLTAALLSGTLPGVSDNPDRALFTLAQHIGGPWVVIAIALCVLAAQIGMADGVLQSVGTLISNDLVAVYRPMNDKGRLLAAKISIAVYTVASALVANLGLSNLITLSIMAYQGVVQLAVPQFLGLFWKRGNRTGTVAGTVAGFVTAAGLSAVYPTFIPWLNGLTSGIVGLAVNLAVYVACAYLLPQSTAERRRVGELFAATAVSGARVTPGRAAAAPPGPTRA